MIESLKDFTNRMQKFYIWRTIRANGGNKKKAAKSLAISEASLYRHIVERPLKKLTGEKPTDIFKHLCRESLEEQKIYVNLKTGDFATLEKVNFSKESVLFKVHNKYLRKSSIKVFIKNYGEMNYGS